MVGIRLHLLLQVLLLYHRLRRHMTQRMRVRRPTRHTLSSHSLTWLSWLTGHAHRTRRSRVLSAGHDAHGPICARLHAHHRLGLGNVRLSRPRDTGVHHGLGHVLALSRRHTGVAVGGHARMHAAGLRLVCGHHLAWLRPLTDRSAQ